MTDRTRAFIVVLDEDYRIGDRDKYPSINGDGEGCLLPTDADAIAWALRMVKGVISVDPIVTDYNAHIARTVAQRELRTKLFDALKDE